MSRAKSSGLKLHKGKDPVVVSPPIHKKPLEANTQTAATQVKQMPDGSVAGRVRPSQKRGGKPGYPTNPRRNKQAFCPPPANIAMTPSSSSVKASRGGFVAACPDDPFAKMLSNYQKESDRP